MKHGQKNIKPGKGFIFFFQTVLLLRYLF